MVPTTLVEQAHFDYDQEECRGMLLEATETVSSIFRFNRPAYADAKRRTDGNDLTENLMAYVKNYSVFLVLQYSNYY